MDRKTEETLKRIELLVKQGTPYRQEAPGGGEGAGKSTGDAFREFVDSRLWRNPRRDARKDKIKFDSLPSRDKQQIYQRFMTQWADQTQKKRGPAKEFDEEAYKKEIGKKREDWAKWRKDFNRKKYNKGVSDEKVQEITDREVAEMYPPDAEERWTEKRKQERREKKEDKERRMKAPWDSKDEKPRDDGAKKKPPGFLQKLKKKWDEKLKGEGTRQLGDKGVMKKLKEMWGDRTDNDRVQELLDQVKPREVHPSGARKVVEDHGLHEDTLDYLHEFGQLTKKPEFWQTIEEPNADLNAPSTNAQDFLGFLDGIEADDVRGEIHDKMKGLEDHRAIDDLVKMYLPKDYRKDRLPPKKSKKASGWRGLPEGERRWRRRMVARMVRG